MSEPEEELRRLREEVKEAEESAEEAREGAEGAQEGAQEAQEGAQEARVGAEGAAGRAQQAAAKAEHHDLTTEERSKEFLVDRRPVEDADESYGTPGRPLRRATAFYMGFMGAVGALLAFWLGQQILSIRSILVLILVAAFLAVGLNPAVEFFLRRGMKRPWAVLAVSLGVLAALALFVLAVVPLMTSQITTIADEAPTWAEQMRSNATFQSLDDRYGIVDRVKDAFQGGKFASTLFGGVLNAGLAVLGAIANAFVILVLMLYFLASLPSIKRFFYRFAPATRRERVTYLGDQILANVGSYVSGAFIVATVAGLASLIFLFSVGLGQYAIALAAVVAILDVIPMIGATLGALIVTAIAFATDPKIGLITLVFYIVYQQFENYVVYPRVMGRAVDIPGSLIVVAALVGAGLLGVVGALLAVPTAAAIQLITKEVFLPQQDTR